MKDKILKVDSVINQKMSEIELIKRLDDLKLAAKNKFASVKFPAFTGLAAYIDDLDFVNFYQFLFLFFEEIQLIPRIIGNRLRIIDF